MSENTTLRVLGRLRLSRSTDESTSIERQREAIQQWSDAYGHRVIGWAEDVDVSGAVDPFDTPQLGAWLAPERVGEWDVLVAWKLDRLGRDAIQLNRLFGWLLEHDKTLMSCSESLNLATTTGRMLASIIAGIAEGELEAIRERARASRAKLRESARWPGGKPPYGYVTVPRDAGGYALRIDPPSAEIVQRIVSELIDGEPVTRIASRLNLEGVRSPADYYRTKELMLRDGETRSGKWSTTPLRNLLRNPALRGQVHHQGTVVRDDEGLPLQFADPLVTIDEWEAVQSILDRVQAQRKHHRPSESGMLSGIITCWWCGANLQHNAYSVKGTRYKYYRCPDQKLHDASMVPAVEAETLLEEQFLEQAGDLPVTERVWVPGDARDSELRESVAALDDLTKLVGTVGSATTRERLLGQISAVDRRILELEQQPAREAHYEYRETGGTYREVWESATPDDRRKLLLRSGIQLRIGVRGRRGGHTGGAWEWHLHIPEPVVDALRSS